MSFSHPPVNPGVDFNHSAQCLAFFRNINATDPEEAAAMLTQLLEGMAVSTPTPSPQGHLETLEELRPTLDFILGEVGKRYAAHPLSPSSREQHFLHQAVHLWSLMVANYKQIGRHYTGNGGAVPQEYRALLLQRRLRYQSLAMTEYFRARQELPPGLWRDLHKIYLLAETAGLANERVPEPLVEPWGVQSPLECYVAMLLVDVGSPYSRSPREFIWMTRWAQRFAPYCRLRDGPHKSPNHYALDTEADSGLRPVATLRDDGQARRLSVSKLATQIKVAVTQLKAGVSAASLGLGEDCVPLTCRRLLMSLYRPWGHGSCGRKFPRRATVGQVQLCTDLRGIAFFLEGKELVLPEEEQIHHGDYRHAEAMMTLGERAAEAVLTDKQVAERGQQQGYVQELWAAMDQSVTGFRLMRDLPGMPLEHRQLIGVRRGVQERMQLAEISWLQFQQDGILHAGVSLMPGPPKVLSVRLHASERQNGRERYRLGFLIPGMAALETERTLLVPAGWFASGRRIDVNESSSWVARMTRLVRRGHNFDRITFEREEAGALV
jgi:cyclic-di-GMP-binding protein